MTVAAPAGIIGLYYGCGNTFLKNETVRMPEIDKALWYLLDRLPAYKGLGCKAAALVPVYFVIGSVLGIFPIVFGLLRKRPWTGVMGFACCLLTSLAFGFLLTIPVCILFSLPRS